MSEQRGAAESSFDFVVIGSGPGGQKAAVCAAKAGQRVALVEQERLVGGACVHRGTIPSKTLRENALRVDRLRQAARLFEVEPADTLELAQLLGRLDTVVKHNAETVGQQLARNGVEAIHGRARFVSDHCVEVVATDGTRRSLEARFVVVAVGSAPRTPPGVPVDHESVLDSDSILSLSYVPSSLTVLGGGVIACEYASIFARLGVAVTIVDKGPRPLAFLDPELSLAFQRSFEESGGRYLGGQGFSHVAFDGVSRVITRLEDGSTVESEKLMVALGRTGCLDGLHAEAAGLEPTSRGNLEVDGFGRTAVAHIYAVGDVAGPPALATAAMEQGRRAARHALGQEPGRFAERLPVGIYTIPEIACVGASEPEAREQHGDARVGRAYFSEVARGQIAGAERGLLKLVADPEGRRLLGAHAVGEGAAELVHVAQMALLANAEVEDFVENVFNFPTFAEAYRIAALDLANRAQDAAQKETEA